MPCNIRKKLRKVLSIRLLLKVKVRGNKSAHQIIGKFIVRYLGRIKVNYEFYCQITFKNKKVISRPAQKTSKPTEETSAKDKDKKSTSTNKNK